MFNKVIIKLSGEGLAANTNEHFDEKTVDSIVSEVIQVKKAGVQVALVVGGGNFWRGRDARPDLNKPKAHQIGMLGTIMNGIYLSEVFRMKGEKAVVMTPFDGCFAERFVLDKAQEYLSNGVITIFAGGTGHPFFSTDSAVAIRGCELRVDAILYAKNIDGVYTHDPRSVADAKKYKTVSYKTVISNTLDVADIAAINMSYLENIPSVVFALSEPGNIMKACKNNDEIFDIGGTIVGNNIEEEFYV